MQIMEPTTKKGTTRRFSLGVARQRVIAFTFLCALSLATLAGMTTAQEPRKSGKAGGLLVTIREGGNVPLRQRLTELSKACGTPFFLDRQVDPEQSMEITAVDVPAEKVLSLVAEKFKLGECLVGKVLYIGPKSTTNRLPGVVAQRKGDVGKLQQARAPWNKSKPLKWDEAASPREIAAALAQEAGMAVAMDHCILKDHRRLAP